MRRSPPGPGGFAALEVPGEIRRRIGHARETPTASHRWPPERAGGNDLQELVEDRELARTVGRLIADELTSHQRGVLLAMIDEVAAKPLAVSLDSTPGALYKTLHDARRKLTQELAREHADDDRVWSRPPPSPPAPAKASALLVGMR
jgi:RNA polymerase sigma-70 factor, ECF subfamily